MEDVIKCPVCGKKNLSDQEFCQFCQARLHPLTGNLKGEDKPIMPGQAPTARKTAELEPALPQWLRDVRSSGRESAEEDLSKIPQTPQIPDPNFSSGADLLAGLSSQAQPEEEDIPDWLANITGETPKPKNTKTESSEVRWVELGDTRDFARPESQLESEPEAPSWLSGMNQQTPQADEKSELDDRLQDPDDSRKPQQAAKPFSFDSSTAFNTAGETPDWLHSMVEDGSAGFNDFGNTANESFTSSDTPDWLRALDVENASPKAGTPSKASEMPSVSSDTPDWLRVMAAENPAPDASAPSESPDTPPAFSETPDWLRVMAAENPAPDASAPPESSDTPQAFSETPDWLGAVDTPNANVPLSNSDLSSWLTTMDEQEKTQSADSAAISGAGLGETEAAADTPDWLKGLETGASSSNQDWLKDFQSSVSEQPVQDATPAWSEDDAQQSSILIEPSAMEESPVPAALSSDMNETPAVPPALMGDAQPKADSDSFFTELPDWLSIVDETNSSESTREPVSGVAEIAPGELPAWVQAMRPADAGISQTSAGDKTMESRGALAGLQGVLPSGLGFSPTSKPKAYSIKLQASEEQQAHAALLDQLLAAETAPVPLDSFSVLGTSRGLRWLLVFLLFAILTVILFMQTQIFALPSSLLVPQEFGGALQAAQSIPESAPVLAVFDYAPALVGEIESAAIPMFDQLMLLRHPRLTFISTSETGSILSQHFISSGILAEHNYQSGVQYLNLGYLPGGSMGIRAFAENPSETAPYTVPQSSNLIDFAPSLAWTLPPLQGVTSLSQFAAMILITDNADSARFWIEQTASAREAVPFIVISSAQAAPMIQPYYASRQITGLVSGLYGGALFEQNNSGRPGTARKYWDAYSIGMLLAMVLILGGGLLNLVLGLRDRAAVREAK